MSTLVTAIKAAELVTVLQGQGPFTVFAPTNAAFKKLPEGQLEDLLKPANRDKLAAILKGHLIKGRVKAADIKAGEVKTLDGEEVDSTVVKVVIPDLVAFVVSVREGGVISKSIKLPTPPTLHLPNYFAKNER